MGTHTIQLQHFQTGFSVLRNASQKMTFVPTEAGVNALMSYIV